MTLRGIIFDWGGVLHVEDDGTVGVSSYRRRLEDQFGLPRGTLKDILKQTAAELDPQDGKADEPTVLALAQQRLEEKAGRSLPPLLQQWRDRRKQAPSVNSDTRELLKALRTTYRLAILSNTNGKLEALLRELSLRNFFEVVFDSGVEGISKPDRRAFNLTAERLGLTMPECVYVDDNLYHVTTARRLGCVAVHYQHKVTPSLRELLISAGVTVAN
jgi:putative hydrolase of the HAD superfamily